MQARQSHHRAVGNTRKDGPDAEGTLKLDVIRKLKCIPLCFSGCRIETDTLLMEPKYISCTNSL